MPNYPIEQFNPQTRRLDSSVPGSGLANGFLDTFCTVLPAYEQFIQGAPTPGGVGQRAIAPAVREAIGFYCPDPPTPFPSLPDIPQPPIWDTGGFSFGSYSGVIVVGQNPDDYSQLAPFGGQWTCNDNVGLPVTGARYLNFGGSNNAYAVRCRRPDGSEHEVAVSGANPFPEPRRVVIQSLVIASCSVPPVPPIVPPVTTYPPPTPGTPPPPIVEIPITINLPQPPGLPDINIPITYAPITPVVNLSPTLEFSPTVNLPGLPAFAPNISLGLGGLTIGGNGAGGLTISDVLDIVNEGGGGDCPDPCEPVDYAAIAQIVFEELDLKFPPGRPVGSGFTDYEAADSRQIVLPDFPVSIDIQVTEKSPDITSYSGGSGGVPVSLVGWYSFGDNTTVGDRHPISYDFSSILVPKGARGFSYTLKGESLATVRVNFLTATEPPN